MMSAEVTHPPHRFRPVYWNTYNRDIQKMERRDVMKEVMIWETFMKNAEYEL